jgi:hypothetical protein
MRTISVQYGRAYIGFNDIAYLGIKSYPIERMLQASIAMSRQFNDKTRCAGLLQHRLGTAWGAGLGGTFTPKDTDHILIQVAISTEEFGTSFECEYAEVVLDTVVMSLRQSPLVGAGILLIDRAYCSPELTSPNALRFVSKSLVNLLSNDLYYSSDEKISSYIAALHLHNIASL